MIQPVLCSVNETRKGLFYQKNRPMEKLLPTHDALLQHARRTVYQAGIWTPSTQSEQAVPSPQEFSWTKEADSWIPVWETIPEVSWARRKLIRCSCKADCSKCKCVNSNLDCSPLCKCKCNSKNGIQEWAHVEMEIDYLRTKLYTSNLVKN